MALICAGSQCVCSESQPGSSVVVSGSAQRPIVIVCPRDAELRQMGDYLRGFLVARGYAVEPDFPLAVAKNHSGPQWILGTLATYPSLGTDVAAPRFAANARDEAYLLDVRAGNQGPMVVLVGKSAAGLRSAVARLVSTVANDGRKLTMAARREVNDPFVRFRQIIMGNAGRRQCPEGSPFKDIDFDTWPVEKTRAYPELYWQFGFNSLQASENRGYGSISGKELERTQNGAIALMKGSRDYHMLVSFDAWSDCLFNEGEAYCWNDPKEHQVMIDYIAEMGRRYGPYVDHVNIHTGDPGGCARNGCDPSYKTPQQITAEYYRVFRHYNPRVMAATSTWGNSRFWLHSPRPVNTANYREYFALNDPRFGVAIADGAKFLNETFMPKEIGIALHQSYNDDQADMLIQAGRPVDVWAWYIGDMEMNNNLYIAMHRVDEDYSRMPDSARDKIRINSVEINFHGWPQIINQYLCRSEDVEPQARSHGNRARVLCGRVRSAERGCGDGAVSGLREWGYPQHSAAFGLRNRGIQREARIGPREVEDD